MPNSTRFQNKIKIKKNGTVQLENSKFDKMATSKGDDNSRMIPSESAVNEDNLDVSFNRATSIFDQDHLPVEDADERSRTTNNGRNTRLIFFEEMTIVEEGKRYPNYTST